MKANNRAENKAEDSEKKESLEERKELVRKLRVLRTQNNLTQAQIAEVLGISQQTYSKYENDKIICTLDSDVIRKICNHYGVSADYLLNTKPKANLENTNKSMIIDEDMDKIVNQVIERLKFYEEK